MFGLMRAKGTDRELWRKHYCGTCKTIGRDYGQQARLLVNHDFVFLSELLTGADDAHFSLPAYEPRTCATLPAQTDVPPLLRYISACTLLLTEYKIEDHALDSAKRRWHLARRLFSKRFRKARRQLQDFGFPLADLDRILSRQSAIEAGQAFAPGQNPIDQINRAAEPTAQATALVFRHGAIIARSNHDLADIGLAFGRLIYWLDAYEDYHRDQRTGSFNPIRLHAMSLPDAAAEIRRQSRSLASSLPTEFAPRLEANVERKLQNRFPLFRSKTKIHHFQPMRTLSDSPLARAAMLTLIALIPAQAGTMGSIAKWVGISVGALVLLAILAVIVKQLGCDCCDCCCDACSSCG